MSTTAALDRALDDLDAGRAPEPEAGRLVAEAASAYLGTDAGQALLKRRAIQNRDHLLLDLAAQHFAGLPSLRAKARAILTAALRYQTSGWRHDRHAMTCPPHRVGTPQGLIWQALKAWPDLPSDTVLRDLLASAGL